MNREELQRVVLGSIPSTSSGRLILAPRFGKTKLIVDLILRDKPGTILYVSPSRELLDRDLFEEFSRWGGGDYYDRMDRVTWVSLPKVIGCYDLIVLDEEHFITERNAINLLSGKLRGRIISMTGTESRSEVKGGIYSLLGLGVLYRLDIGAAVEGGILSDYSINVISVPMCDGKIYGGLLGTSNEAIQYSLLNRDIELCSHSPMYIRKQKMLSRVRFVHNSVSKLSVVRHLLGKLYGQRNLIFCSNIRQAELLSDSVYHSKSGRGSYESFQRGEVSELCMVNCGGTGFTYRGIDNLILVQCDSDVNGRTSQKISRTLLSQGDYKARVWIVELLGTQDIIWVENTLRGFSSSKVRRLEFNDLNNKEIYE